VAEPKGPSRGGPSREDRWNGLAETLSGRALEGRKNAERPNADERRAPEHPSDVELQVAERDGEAGAWNC